MVRPEAGWWPRLAAVLAGAADPLGARRLPLHLLLLPRRLLQGVLGRPAVLRRRRAAQELPGEQLFPLILQNVHRYFLYLALLFLFLLASTSWKAIWFADPATGTTHFGIGVGTLVLAANVVLLAATRSAATRSATSSAAARSSSREHPAQTKLYDCVELPQPPAHAWAWISLFWVGSPISTCASARWASGTDWRIL